MAGNPSLAPSTLLGASVTPGAAQIGAVALADVSGNLVRTSDDGTGAGLSYLGGISTGIALPTADYTASQSPVTCGTAGWTYATLDITFNSFTGGTTPNITFFVEREGADGVWYLCLATGAYTSAQVISVDLSPDLNQVFQAPPTSAQQHNVFTHTARLRWVLAGGVPATSANFSASLTGRSRL